MKRKGYSLIFVIIIFAMIFMISSYMLTVVFMQSKMSIASADKIQAYYEADSKLKRVMYDDVYSSEIVKEIIKSSCNIRRNEKPDIDMNIKLISDHRHHEDKIGNVRVNTEYLDGRLNLKYVSRSEYKGFKNEIVKYVNMINPVFERGRLPLISYDLDFDTCILLDDFYRGIEDGIDNDLVHEKMKLVDTFDSYSIELNAIDSNRYSITTIKNHISFKEEIIKSKFPDIGINMRNNIYVPIDLRVLNSDWGILTLNGVIYLEGDLIISGGFKFNGVLVLKGQDSKIVVNSDIIPEFKGIILTEGNSDFIEHINLQYEESYIYKYGIYLPGFLRIN